jgi:hypothetical protein
MKLNQVAEAVDINCRFQEANQVGMGLKGVHLPLWRDRSAKDNRVVADIGAEIDHRIAGAYEAEHGFFYVQFPGTVQQYPRRYIDILRHDIESLAAMRPAQNPVAEKYRCRPRRDCGACLGLAHRARSRAKRENAHGPLSVIGARE